MQDIKSAIKFPKIRLNTMICNQSPFPVRAEKKETEVNDFQSITVCPLEKKKRRKKKTKKKNNKMKN